MKSIFQRVIRKMFINFIILCYYFAVPYVPLSTDTHTTYHKDITI